MYKGHCSAFIGAMHILHSRLDCLLKFALIYLGIIHPGFQGLNF